jgi:cytochrome b6-f complex iron-sulfur subunit
MDRKEQDISSNTRVTRRNFIGRTAKYVASVAVIAAGFSFLRLLVPGSRDRTGWIEAGPLSSFPFNDFTLIEEHGVFIFRSHEGVRAVSAICTHLGCMIEKAPDGFLCPCHGSSYNRSGRVLSGAASQDLSWFRVEKDSRGILYIDMNEPVGPDALLKT